MEQTCTEYQGIQLSARSCDDWCEGFSSCGECTAQYGCHWGGSSCQQMLYPDRTYPIEYTGNQRCCDTCTTIDVAYDCMETRGCGWAPFERKCISGTPDFPCDDTVTVIQWDPPAYC